MDIPEIRWTRTDLNPRARERARGVLSVEERDRHDAMPAHARASFLAGRLLLRTLAADLMGLTPLAVQLTARCPDCGGAHGKPQLRGESLHLSLSRTDMVVVAAASWDALVGIDVERLDQPAERIAAIGVITGEATLSSWTRAEAVLKADGRGMRVDPALVGFEETAAGLQATVADSAVRYLVREVDVQAGLLVSTAVAL